MDDIVWPPKKSAKLKRMRPVRTEEPAMHKYHLAPAILIRDTIPLPEPGVAPEEPTPEEVPAETTIEPEPVNEDTQAPEPVAKTPIEPPKKTKKLTWRVSFQHIHLSKKQWALIIAILIVLAGGGAVGVKALYSRVRKPVAQSKQVKTTKKVVVVKKPVLEPSRLTGSLVSPADNLRPVTGIMIENSPDARPQSGLNEAGVVYEAIAEGGITRFLAVYQEARPQYIGPVRSIRPYYLDFVLPYDGSIAHVGGAPQAISDITSLGVKDLDQFYNGNSYLRITARYAPHNVYTNFDLLDALNAKKGFTTSTFTGFVRKTDMPSKLPTARSVDIAISGPLYDSHYDYDGTTNTYRRSEGGKPHVNERSGSQLAPKVVIALVMNRGIASDGQHTDYTTSSSGAMIVFQDGIVTNGTWAKASRKGEFVFTDASGATLKLNPGQTWITLVDAATDVTYK